MKEHYLGHRKRLKERFNKAPESLYDYELLELLLGFVIKGKDVKPVAKEILYNAGNLQNTITFDMKEINGVGAESVLLFKLINQYIKRIEEHSCYGETYCVDSPDSVFNFLKHLIGAEGKEHFVTIFLDGKNSIISHKVATTGTVNQAAVYPREIARQALDENAVSVIFAHNHPSGNTSPSDDDILLTHKLVDTLKLLDIRVLDHLIICREGFYSLKKNGDM